MEVHTTQKQVIKWSVHFETMRNIAGSLCDSRTKESGGISNQGSLIDNEDTTVKYFCLKFYLFFV